MYFRELLLPNMDCELHVILTKDPTQLLGICVGWEQIEGKSDDMGEYSVGIFTIYGG
jgi:hypothetical protein